MSRTIAIKREKAPEEQTLSAELPPIAEWQVHFTEPGAPAPQVPWDPKRGRVESSGLIFLQGVAERLKQEEAEWTRASSTAAAEPFQALPTTGNLAPVAQGSHRGVVYGAAFATLLVLGVGAMVGLRVWRDGGATSEAGALALTIAPEGSTPSVAAAPAVVADVAVKGEPRPATASPTPRVVPATAAAAAPAPGGVLPPADAPAARAVTASDSKRHARLKHNEYRAKRRAERKAEQEAEARRVKELQSLPSAYAALNAVRPTPAAPRAVPSAREAAPRPTLAIASAAAGADTYQMLRSATARMDPRPRPAAPAVELPRKLSAKVLYARAQSVQARARGCLRTFGFSHEVLQVRIEIVGATGRVARASVQGRFRTMPVGQCVERAARGLTFPRFTDARQTVVVPVTGK